ncbi:MAG: DNA replication/repair protein RecF [Eubacteriales bacterium]|nr:DNA replication/repair protein RecF [Eubacteriales bacterium]
MYVSGLWAKNFRNYEQLYLPLKNELTVLSGANAQGKTNVLEAVFFCCTARSHRTKHERDLIRIPALGADPAAKPEPSASAYLRAEAEARDGRHRVEVRIGAGGKSILVNGLPVRKVGELLGQINCVMFSPEDLSLVKDGPDKRRRFIDIEISQIKKTYYYALQKYYSALDQRNKLLKQLAFADPSLAGTLDVWDEQLAVAGAAIIAARYEFVARLGVHASAIHRFITAGKEDMTLSYAGSAEESDAARMTEELLTKLRVRREDDLRRATTTVGPHRDDLVVTVNGKDMRAFGSQGQQRTCALSLKLSEMDLVNEYIGEYPVLLLDDVLSELDVSRQEMLLDNIRAKQTLLTTAQFDETLARRFADCRLLEVRAGCVTPR